MGTGFSDERSLEKVSGWGGLSPTRGVLAVPATPFSWNSDPPLGKSASDGRMTDGEGHSRLSVPQFLHVY